MPLDLSKCSRAGLVLFTLLVLWSLLGCQIGQDNTVPRATEADLKEAIRDSVRLTPDLSIKQQSSPIIDRDRRGKLVTYLIESRLVDQYWFKITDYRLDWAGDHSEVNLDKISAAIDRAYENRTSLARLAHELTGTMAANAPNGVAGVTISGPLDALLELLGVIRRVTRLNIERAEIAIKGYADGEVDKDWSKPLPDKFRRFPVLQPSEPHNQNWFFYRREEKERKLPNSYGNKELPDLRAQFVRKEFVEPFVRSSENAERCHVYVLHNKPIAQPNLPGKRKAQVYLMVYLKEER